MRAGSSATEKPLGADLGTLLVDECDECAMESVPVALAELMGFDGNEAAISAAGAAAAGARAAGGTGSVRRGWSDSGGPTGVVAFSNRPSSAIRTGSSWTDAPLAEFLGAADRCEGVMERVPVTLALWTPSPRVSALAIDARAAGGALEAGGGAGAGATTAGTAIFCEAVDGIGPGVAPVLPDPAFAAEGTSAASAAARSSKASPGSISTEMPPLALRGTVVERRWPADGATCIVPVTRPVRGGDTTGAAGIATGAAFGDGGETAST